MIQPRWLLPLVLVIPAGIGLLAQSGLVAGVVLLVCVAAFIFYGRWYKNNN